MIKRALFFGLLSLLAYSASIHAEETPASKDLYLEAMQALAEGRKNDASRMLEQMKTNEPRHAGAWLDLALIQCELGKPAEAERLFQEIERRFQPPLEILQIIDARRSQGCVKAEAQSQWNVLLARGHEQNVNQGASNPNFTIRNGTGSIELPLLPDFLPKADQYLQLSGDYLRTINQNGGLMFAQFQARRNDDLHRYDSASVFLGVEQPWRVGNWAVRTSAMLGFLSLGGQLYQKQIQLQAKVIPPLALPKTMELQLSTSTNHLQYMSLANFDANTFEARAQLQYRNGDVFGSTGLAFLNDHATGDRPGGRRRGWQVHAQGRTHLSANVYGEIGWSRQTWVGQSAYSPGLIEQVRDQNQQTLRAAVIYPWSERQSLQLEVRQVWNKENISIFQYNNRQIQLSWLWQNR